MAESVNLKSWLAANNMTELLEILVDSGVSEISDLTECLEDVSEIDAFLEDLNIISDAQTQVRFRNALLVLCKPNGIDALKNEGTIISIILATHSLDV